MQFTMHVKSLLCLIFCVISIAVESGNNPARTGHSTGAVAGDGESVQQEVKKFYNSLNAEEKAELRKFAKTNAANFSLTDTQFMDSLKEEATGLFGKLSGLRDVINAKLDTMQPESRIFVENVLRKFLAAFGQDGLMNILDAMKGLGKDILDMFDRLAAPTQQDIMKAFPTIGSIATSDVVRLLLQKVAEFDLVSKTWTPAPTVDLDTGDSGKPNPKKSRHHSPGPQPIEPAEPGTVDLDPEPTPPTRHGKKGIRTTTLYPPIGEDEPLHIKELVDSK